MKGCSRLGGLRLAARASTGGRRDPEKGAGSIGDAASGARSHACATSVSILSLSSPSPSLSPSLCMCIILVIIGLPMLPLAREPGQWHSLRQRCSQACSIMIMITVAITTVTTISAVSGPRALAADAMADTCCTCCRCSCAA